MSLNWGVLFVENELFVMQIWGFILCKYKGMSIFTFVIYFRFEIIYTYL